MSICEDLCSVGLIRKDVVYFILPLITIDSAEYDYDVYMRLQPADALESGVAIVIH